jgi:L-cysteate sulfo-lyase
VSNTDVIRFSYQELPVILAERPRLALARLPTPIERLSRFSQYLGGPEIWIKRDDLTGLATGGNKARKLEFLLGDAISKGADSLITAGGSQSNHCRQTAAAAARAGMECHLVFGGSSESPLVGNRFLDRLLGAYEHWTPKGTRDAKMAELAEELAKRGKNPYVIPVGGSNPIGALGYVAAMYELKQQLDQAALHFDYLVFATSSGGTQAGVVVGAKLTKCESEIIAISIDQVPAGQCDSDYKSFVLSTGEGVNTDLNLGLTLSLDDFPINYDYLGQGYGVVGDPEREAIKLLAQTEGILVDPVYAGRALAGLIDLVRRRKFKPPEKTLFWHTGGETALHAYVQDLAGL